MPCPHIWTCSNAAHFAVVPTHQGDLLSLCGNNRQSPTKKNKPRFIEDKLQECAFLPSLPPSLSPATIPSLAILAPLPLCQMVKLFKLDNFLTPAAQNGRGDFKVGFREAEAETEWPVSTFVSQILSSENVMN